VRAGTGKPFSLIALAAAMGLTWALPSPSYGDFKVTGDNQITGQAGVGTLVPRARLEARMAAGDNFALKVSSQNGSALMVVDKAGKTGIGMSNPQGNLDVFGSGDGGNIGLQLRVGNSSSTTSSSQIVFVYGSTETFRHSLRTRSVDGQNLFNAIDFFLWRSTGQPGALGSLQVLSLQAVPAASTGSVHIDPAGDPDVELEVSNGATTGGGAMHRASAGTHSSREIKTDISYMDQAQELGAYEDVKALRHARFRYKAIQPSFPPYKPMLVRNPTLPLARGLIYEDAPESIQGPGKTVILDDRVLNLEMALKEINRRIAELENRIPVLEKRKKHGGGR